MKNLTLITLLSLLFIGCDKSEPEALIDSSDCPCLEVYVVSGDGGNNEAELVPLKKCIIEWDYEMIISDLNQTGKPYFDVKFDKALELSKKQGCR